MVGHDRLEFRITAASLIQMFSFRKESQKTLRGEEKRDIMAHGGVYHAEI